MIQRIQSVYFLISAILMVVCACLPLGTFLPKDLGSPSEMYNICIINGDTGKWDVSCIALFILLLAGVVMTVMNIFNYRNRKSQMRNCRIIAMILVLWVVAYCVFTTVFPPEGFDFKYGYAAAMPLFSLVFNALALKGIKHDDDLIKAADRIR